MQVEKKKPNEDDARFAIFGTLPIDRTSTLTDDQDKLEHILNLGGNKFIEVPAKNILIELFM